MTEKTIQAQARQGNGKGLAGRLRRQGLVPGVVYGKEVGSLAVALPAKELERLLNEGHDKSLIRLVVPQGDGTTKLTTLIREVQRHPLRGEIIHTDFYQVSLKEKLQTSVPVYLEGEAPGVKQGGILQHGLREVEVECLPEDLPDSLTLDLSNLQVGGKLTIGDLQLPAGVDLLSDPQIVVVTLIALRISDEDEKAETAGEETATPGE